MNTTPTKGGYNMASINLEELMERAKEFADVAGKKTNELYELSKYKYESVRISNELKKLYEKLGLTVYKLVRSGNTDNSEIDAVTAEIDDAKRRLMTIKMIMADMQNKKFCPCGAVNPKDALFCSKCGAKLDAEEKCCEDGCCEAEAPAEEPAE